jgi:hypothetical protein
MWVKVKRNPSLECAEEEKIIEKIHVCFENCVLATMFRVQVVDVARVIGLVPSHRFSLSMCDKSCGKKLAELLDEFAQFFCLVAVWD